MLQSKHLPPRRLGRLARFEILESRLPLDGEGALLGSDAHLTLSFAPDSTDVAGQANALFARFNAVAPQADWQAAILRAFQTWGMHTNADIGLVVDGGDPFGTPGAARRDERFGDIRIAAVPMEPQIGAISVPIDNVLSGTWYADVVFNTAFNYQSVDDIFAIALHEAGNVFGLEDNNDPNSPLMAGPIPTATVPTAADIANLRALHGVRAPDANELVNGVSNPNNTLGSATDLEFGATDDDEVDAPALIYGDLQTAADIDFFELTVPHNYTGGMTVQLRTEGFSQLKPTVALLNASGATIVSGSSVAVGGDRVEIDTPSVVAGGTYFVRVASATSDLFAVGGYSLVVILDEFNVVSQLEIDAAADGSLRFVDADDLEILFDPEADFYNDDLGANDTPATATQLEAAPGFGSGERFEAIGSIVPGGDADYYRLTAPGATAGSVMYVAIRSLDSGRIIPAAEVFDVNLQPLPAQILVNGAGEYLIEITSIPADAELFVRVAASTNSGPFVAGNYAFAVSFAPIAAQLETFATGAIANVLTQKAHPLYVAEPQLFHIALQAGPLTGSGLVAVVAEVVDDLDNVIHRIAAPTGATRSAGAVFLPIGSYTIRVSARAFGAGSIGPVAYSVIGAAFSDPFVGDGTDPTTNPFACTDPELAGFYCYPGEIISSDPFLWDDFVNSLPDPPPEIGLQELVTLLLGDWWSWLWGQTSENGPPLAVNDAIGPPGSGQSASYNSAVSVLQNDLDPNGDPMVALLTGPAPVGGTVTLNPDGTFAYSGNAGQIQFSYIAYDFRLESTAATVTFVADATLAGDFSGDNIVDAADYVAWRKGLGTTYDQQDFQIWRTNYGAMSTAGLQLAGSGSSAVAAGKPELSPNLQAVIQPILQADTTSSFSKRTHPLLHAPVVTAAHLEHDRSRSDVERGRERLGRSQVVAHLGNKSLSRLLDLPDSVRPVETQFRDQIRDAAFERYSAEGAQTKVLPDINFSVGPYWWALPEIF